MSANIGFLAVIEVDIFEQCIRLRCPSCNEHGGWCDYTNADFPYDYYVDHRDDCPRFIETKEDKEDNAECPHCSADGTGPVCFSHALGASVSAHSAVEIGQRVKFTIRAVDGLGGTSYSYRATLSGKRGAVTDLPERHMALVLWDGHEKPESVVRHYLEPEYR